MRWPCLCLVLLLVGCSRPRTIVNGELVSFTTTQGIGQGRLYVPDTNRGARPALLVLHGDHGLTEAIEAHARRLAQGQGYIVLAVDLYRGEKIDSLLDAHIMDRGLPEERVKADLQGAVDFLKKRPDVRPDALGIIGWDMGGGYALDAARADSRLKAVVICYGRLTTEAELLKSLNASVLALMAGRDEGNPASTREAFREAMTQAGKTLAGLHVFETSDHGFMNPLPDARPGPDDEANREQAWKLIEEFFARELQP